MTEPTCLVVEDDRDFRESLELLLGKEGFETRGAGSLERARACLEEIAPDVVLIDLELPDGSGLDLMDDDALAHSTEFIVVTGHASVDSAVAALRDGALDYLTKPIDRARLKTVLTNFARTRALKRELGGLRQELQELGRFGRMVGRSKPMQEVYNLIARVAPTNATVLVTGESGTGKELVAETIHALSRRSSGPFLAVNCGAVSPSLIESELFGHERGSFTGADRRRQGYFERAGGGTIFLDEIAEMPVELQVKLLRVLETGHLMRVGGTEPIAIDARVVAATNRVPEEAVESGDLREDLYYRLNVFPIPLPPLRQRAEDLDLLAEHFLAELNSAEGRAKRWTPEALEQLRGRSWPGNVREFKNAVERAFILADEEIDGAALRALEPIAEAPAREALEVRVGSEIAEVERRLILATLEHFDGDKKRTAEVLGISLKTLYNRLNVYKAERRG